MSLKVSRLLSDLRPSRVTAEEVIGGQDLSDKTIVVTGGNSGTTSPSDGCRVAKPALQADLADHFGLSACTFLAFAVNSPRR